MSEIVRLHHPNGLGYDQIRIISRDPLNMGGTESKELVKAALIRQGHAEEETTFVSKKPRPQMFLENNGINLDPKVNPAGVYGAIWWGLQQRGLPVVPYLRVAWYL